MSKNTEDFSTDAALVLLSLESAGDDVSKKMKRLQTALARTYNDGYDESILDNYTVYKGAD